MKLLRCGAHVVATTRFPQESSGRFAVERDYDEWKHRLDIVGLDLRSTVAIEEFCEFIRARFARVDILVNNACQVCAHAAHGLLHCAIADTICFLHVAWTKSVRKKGLAQPQAWNAGDVSALPEQACELAGVPRGLQARPLSAYILT